jgi:chaperone modulatory protein CbpM
MANEQAESAWLGEEGRVSLEELAALSGLTDAALRELVGYGVLQPLDTHETQWIFSAHWVVVARKACRLRDDFELDLNALALTLSFLDRIRDLESQLRSARAQAPQRHVLPSG